MAMKLPLVYRCRNQRVTLLSMLTTSSVFTLSSWHYIPTWRDDMPL